MRPSFNVLNDAWIPVITLDGRAETVSVRQVLQRASELQEISITTPTEEFSVYRFLSVLLMDALRPETADHIQSIVRRGTFDMQKIERYFTLCEQVGLSFDILNQSRPFLQPPYNKNWDKSPESVTRLDFGFPSGNNHVHFEHRDADTISYSYGEAFQKLLASYVFAPQGGAGYSPSINGSPPFYALINGENLFQTLCMLLVPLENYMPYVESQPGIGRMEDIEPKKVRGIIDPETNIEDPVYFFQAMLFPVRRIRLIPDEYSDTVSKVTFGPGFKYGGGTNWTDPNVSYIWQSPNKEGVSKRFPFKPDLDVPVWQNYTQLIQEEGRPTVLSQYIERNPDWSRATITLYGLQTDQAKCCNYLRRTLTIPRLILENKEKAACIKECVTYSESVKWRLEKALRIALQAEKPDAKPKEAKKANAAVKAAGSCFVSRCEPVFLALIDHAGAAPDCEQEAILKQWKKDIFKIAKDLYASTAGGFHCSGRVLRRVAEGERILYGMNRSDKED